MKQLHLSTARCIIRNFSEDDLFDLYEVLSDARVMAYIEPPFSLEDTKKFIADAGQCEEPMVYALIWKETMRVIGHVVFHPYEEDSYEIGWIINRKYWNKGIASEVTDSLLAHAKRVAIHSCIIECDPEQVASIHIAQKFGFMYEGQVDRCSVFRKKLT